MNFYGFELWPTASLFSLSLLSLASFTAAALAVFQQKKSSEKPTLHLVPSKNQQTDTVNDYLVNTVEHLRAKEPDISPRS